MTGVATLVERFTASVERNAGQVDAVGRGVVATLVAERVEQHLGSAPREDAPVEAVRVAVPGADALLDDLGIVDELTARGVPLLLPDDPAWRAEMARAPVGLTGSVAAVAETGTVAIVCGPGQPRAVSLLPDTHVCVVSRDGLEATLEEAFARAVSAGLPSNLVWVSGPSRSADIEKRITLGVHGPRRFEVVLVE